MKNRKMWFSVFSIVVVCLGMVFAALVQAAAALYPTFVGAIIGLAATYVTGNVVQKAVAKPPEEIKSE